MENQEQKEVKYPVDVHHRLIVLRDEYDEGRLRAALAPYKITADLEQSNESKGGKYISFGFSAMINSRDELYALDSALRAVPGMKMVL